VLYTIIICTCSVRASLGDGESGDRGGVNNINCYSAGGLMKKDNNYQRHPLHAPPFVFSLPFSYRVSVLYIRCIIILLYIMCKTYLYVWDLRTTTRMMY